MLTRKHAILAAAALAATPMFTKAAIVTFAYEPSQITVNGVVTALGGTASAPTLTVPAGAIIDIGATATVTGNPNAAAGDAYYTAKPTLAMPNLGLLAYGFGFNTSSSTIASFDSTVDAGGVNVNADFITPENGVILGNGNIQGSSVSGANNGATLKASATAGIAALSYGAGTAADIFNGLQIDAGTGNGTAVITPTNLLSSNSYAVYNSGGTSSTNVPVYKNLTTSSADTVNALPALTIIVGNAVTSTTTTASGTHQPIVALLGATPSTYGSQIGNPIVITGSHGSYTVGFTGTTLTDVGGQGFTTGYTAASVFNPITDTEVYALKLNVSGAALSPTSTLVGTIVTDINNGTGAGTAGVNVSAGAVVGSPYASLFPGYDVLLVSTGAFGGASSGGVADLGIDFSQDTDLATPGLVVTEVAAVPEPATAAGLVLGATGLLLGRRKKQLASA
jgi:hypothetical protein